jgi:dynactin complex subunit
MVNYNTLTIGLEVEFMHEEKVCAGRVKYKGKLNGQEDMWVGVEADQPVGYCDGRIAGVTYFKCQNPFGLFLRSDELRVKRARKNR